MLPVRMECGTSGETSVIHISIYLFFPSLEAVTSYKLYSWVFITYLFIKRALPFNQLFKYVSP